MTVRSFLTKNCALLIISDCGHLFLCLPPICVSLKKCLHEPFFIFNLIFCYWVLELFFLFYGYWSLRRYAIYNYFLLFCGCFSTWLIGFFAVCIYNVLLCPFSLSPPLLLCCSFKSLTFECLISPNSFPYVVLTLQLHSCMWVFRFPSTSCWKNCLFSIDQSRHPCKNSILCSSSPMLCLLC